MQDDNSRPTLICASNVDGNSIVEIKVDPTLHALKVDDGTTGSNNGNNLNNAQINDSGVSVCIALSSVANADGSRNIVEVYGDPITGEILINSQ